MKSAPSFSPSSLFHCATSGTLIVLLLTSILLPALVRPVPALAAGPCVGCGMGGGGGSGNDPVGAALVGGLAGGGGIGSGVGAAVGALTGNPLIAALVGLLTGLLGGGLGGGGGQGGAAPHVGTPIEEQPPLIGGIGPTQTGPGGQIVAPSGSGAGSFAPLRPTITVSPNGLSPLSTTVARGGEVVLTNPTSQPITIEIRGPIGAPVFPPVTIPAGTSAIITPLYIPGTYQVLSSGTSTVPILGTFTVL